MKQTLAQAEPPRPAVPSAYRKPLDSSLDVICSIDRDGRFIDLSAATQAVWGYSPDELRGRSYMELVFSEDRELTQHAAAAIMAGHDMTNFENRYCCADGSVRPILWSARWDDAEQVMYCVAKDARVLKDAEGRARVLRERLYRAYKLSGIGWWEWDPVTGEQSASDELYLIYGLTRARYPELSLEVFRSLVHPEDEGLMQENLRRIYNESTYSYEHRIIRPDGRTTYLQHHVNVERHDGNIIRVNDTTKDITREKLNALALRSSEESYRQLFENIPLPTWVYDLEAYRFLDVNDAAIQHYGYSRSEFRAMTLWDIRPESEHAHFGNAIEQHRYTSIPKADVGQYVHCRKDGSTILVEVSIVPIEYKGRPAMLTTIKDITAKTQLQEELMREKILHQQDITRATIEAQERERSEIGKELHDNVNQVLTTIKLYIENIRNYPEQGSLFVDKTVALTQRAINEIRYLARQLVTPVINDLDFRATIEELILQYDSLQVFRIKLELQFEEKLLDKELQLTIYRIVQEQLNNIVKYASAKLVSVSLTQAPGELRLKICDDGAGFDPAAAGKGLGLRNIRSRVEIYKGHFELRSAPGTGCCLQASFPV
ncbi:MAG: PAS domain S-box protein [Sphingobacteriales bacterium]|nr:MAG: PAS domain S-box protein [Sphingobacteriales bacterium]